MPSTTSKSRSQQIVAVVLLLLFFVAAFVVVSVSGESAPPTKLHQDLIGSFGLAQFELRKIDIATGKYNHSEEPLFAR